MKRKDAAMHRGFVTALAVLAACDTRLGPGGEQTPDASDEGVTAVDAARANDASVDAALGAWSMPVLVPGMPTMNGEIDDPTLTGDMLELYFNMSADIYMMKRNTLASAWSPPIAVAALNTPTGETTPDVSGDGLTIYFASQRPGGLGDYDLWISTRASRQDPWNEPVHVRELSSAAGEATASMTQDQLAIVMSSNRKDGMLHSLYMSTRPTTASPWGPPAELTSLDLVGEETSGFLVHDGLTIYFDAAPGGDRDLYYATRASRSVPFAPPIRLTLPSSAARDFDPWVSADQRHMFLASERAGIVTLYEVSR
jgi:hypothetical protein